MICDAADRTTVYEGRIVEIREGPTKDRMIFKAHALSSIFRPGYWVAANESTVTGEQHANR